MRTVVDTARKRAVGDQSLSRKSLGTILSTTE
jgi:hypothetical protein